MGVQIPLSALVRFLGTTRGRVISAIALVAVFALSVGVTALVYRATPKTPATAAVTKPSPTSAPTSITTPVTMPICPPGVNPSGQCRLDPSGGSGSGSGSGGSGGGTLLPPTGYGSGSDSRCTYSATAARCIPYGSLLTGQSLSCRLPLSTGQAGGSGFLTFPSGQYQTDAASNVRPPDVGQSQGNGGFGGSYAYDFKFSKWLPVDRAMVSPDGAHYAFNSGPDLYLVDVATDKATLLGSGFIGLDYEAVGVYARRLVGGAFQPGLWLLSTQDGKPSQLTNQGYFQKATDTAAFGNDAPSYPQGAVNHLVRYDYKSGSLVTILDRNTEFASILGFDGSGQPVLAIGPTVYFLTTPNTLQGLVTGIAAQSVLADSHGLWISGTITTNYQPTSATFLFSAGGFLQNMSSVVGQISGSCI